MSLPTSLNRPLFPELCPVTAALEQLADEGGPDQRGAIFTRREVVEFILDVCGWRHDEPLPARRLLEPSCGAGDFLLPAIERLLIAWAAQGRTTDPVGALGNCICAVELHRDTFEQTRGAVVDRLAAAGLTPAQAQSLADRWLLRGDFLLADIESDFDVVVGNPPYVRQELIPSTLLAEYRRRFRTLYDRADLYVPFIERSLHALKPGGVLGFICADRWMKNRYGGPLRALVSSAFNLRVHVDMNGAQAFHADVAAYPAITVIAREAQGTTRRASCQSLEVLPALAAGVMAPYLARGASVEELSDVVRGDAPWVLDGDRNTALLRKLESAYPTLEEAGCKVGIGVATGADEVFIGPYEALDVEPSRKLPLVTTRDIASGEVHWQGRGVINPFEADGSLVDLAAYPRLGRHLQAHRERISARHVARKAPARWYRTIDRINPALVSRPKLLVPDIKGQAHIVYDEGRFYPHHNLYYVTAQDWDLRALQGVLLSSLARWFVSSYSTKMRGGFLRFQAQYLRRIRLPLWAAVPVALRSKLAEAAVQRDIERCDEAVMALYGLDAHDRALLKPGNMPHP